MQYCALYHTAYSNKYSSADSTRQSQLQCSVTIVFKKIEIVSDMFRTRTAEGSLIFKAFYY